MSVANSETRGLQYDHHQPQQQQQQPPLQQQLQNSHKTHHNQHSHHQQRSTPTKGQNIISDSIVDSPVSSVAQQTSQTPPTPQPPNSNEQLSRTNLYIKGLQPGTKDGDLLRLCIKYGEISSTKAIPDKNTGCCKGYGFVEFKSPQAAEVAVQELIKSGVQAQMARIPLPYYSIHTNHHNNNNNSSHSNYNNGSNNHRHHNHHSNHNNQHHGQRHNSISGSKINSTNNHPGNNDNHSGALHQNANVSNNHHQNTADPTNLYIANLPPNMSEEELEKLLSTFGPVLSTKILRDESDKPRGVGFARMESRDKCEKIIEELNGKPYKNSEPLLVKYADGKNKRRLHHFHHNHHHYNNQQQHHGNNHHQHHKIHQDDSRWRDSGNNMDMTNTPTFDRRGNISHSNQLTDLAMVGPMGYPRIQPGFAPTIPAGAPYPSPLGPPTSAPQWIHTGGPGQPYVIPQQMFQAGGIGPNNQAAAAAALHYGHIPQLTSQMQGLQLGPHPGGPVGGFIPSQHQWSPVWTIPQHHHHHQQPQHAHQQQQPVPPSSQQVSPQPQQQPTAQVQTLSQQLAQQGPPPPPQQRVSRGPID